MLSLADFEEGLNPYCSGRWSRTFRHHHRWFGGREVLILIVVEDGLVPGKKVKVSSKVLYVLILVVVEDGLVQMASYLYVSARLES